ncbi:MAG: hypothetical protein HQL35_12465, partial [Alphaproteobacteria bacterium]|nr:hypothetical protein [Alphaproteobacteria bacterium]
GDVLRTALHYHPPINIRPASKDAGVSDMFPWRNDEVWDTRFDITNTASLVFSDAAPEDTITLVLFAMGGRELARHTFALAPFEVRPIVIGDYLPEGAGPAGTFSVFHSAPAVASRLRATGTHLAERGYLSFKRKQDDLWSSVHGNLHALSMSPSGTMDYAHGRLDKVLPYRIQCRFDDCRRFEMTFTNPSPEEREMEVILFDVNRTKIGRQVLKIAPRGLGLFTWDNQEASCAMVEGRGSMFYWRPAIFKHYDTHFNILHS